MALEDNFDPSGASNSGGIFGLPTSVQDAAVVLLPVPWEPTTSYGRGTSKGPAAILAASAQVDLFDVQTGRPYEAGIALAPFDSEIEEWNQLACSLAEPIIAKGGDLNGDAELSAALQQVNALCRRLNDRVERWTAEWLDRGRLVGVIGGDHACPFGAIKAHHLRYPQMGILHIDAHADLRSAYEGFEDSHASIMFNVLGRLPTLASLVQVGIRDLCEDEYDRAANDPRITSFYDVHLARRLASGTSFWELCQEIVEALPKEVYISFDIDGLDPTQCPRTGTPVPGGLSFRDIGVLLECLTDSGRRIVGFDLNEVAPGPPGDEWDANVGARILYKLIGFALRSRR